MVFKHEEQNKNAINILEKMSQYPDKIQLAKTRYVTMDVSKLRIPENSGQCRIICKIKK